MNPSQFNLSPQLFIKAFPFHIAFNRDRKIVQVGEVLQNLSPEILVGSLIEQHFQIIRPRIQLNFSEITKRSQSLFIILSLHNGMNLKGQMMYEQEQDIMFFLCSVWVNNIESLAAYNLKLKDFAVHDQTVDLIYLLQGKNTALEDIHKLTEELIQQKLQLENALKIQENLTQTTTTQSQKLTQALKELQQAQFQLIQTEKMSSLGQLVAGVTHEVNNPINFIYGNIKYIREYTQFLISLIDLYQKHYPQPPLQITELLNENDIKFIIDDLPKILSSMEIGSHRIREIVRNLRSFSRLNEAEMKLVDIHHGIDSTLLILHHHLQPQLEHQIIEIIKEYGEIPPVECYAGQLNQVFMDVLKNAIDSLQGQEQQCLKEGTQQNPGCITIRTQVENQQWVTISIKDNGPGMTEKVKAKLFDPFFTTKPVGEGMGLGLSISYQIVVAKHGGKMECISTLGEGAEFVIKIPLRQKKSADYVN